MTVAELLSSDTNYEGYCVYTAYIESILYVGYSRDVSERWWAHLHGWNGYEDGNPSSGIGRFVSGAKF